MFLFFLHNILFQSELANWALVLGCLLGLPISWYFIIRGAKRYLRKKRGAVWHSCTLIGALLLYLANYYHAHDYAFLSLLPFGFFGGWPGFFIVGTINIEALGYVGLYILGLMNIMGAWGFIDWLSPTGIKEPPPYQREKSERVSVWY